MPFWRCLYWLFWKLWWAFFKRAKTKSVPDNWYELGDAFRRERRAYMDSVEYDKLDDPRKWTKKLGSETGLPTGEMEWPIELVCPSKEDVEAFFETVLSVEKLCENIRIGTQLEKRVASGEDVEEVNDSDPRDFRLLWFFRVCWVRTYTDYPIILVDELSGRLSSLTINPHVAYLSGQVWD